MLWQLLAGVSVDDKNCKLGITQIPSQLGRNISRIRRCLGRHHACATQALHVALTISPHPKGSSSRPAPPQHARLKHALTIRIIALDLIPLVRVIGESTPRANPRSGRIHVQRPDHKAGHTQAKLCSGRIYSPGQIGPR